MAITIEPMRRELRYNGVRLAELPGATIEQSRQVYAVMYPELTNAELVTGELINGVQHYEFRRAVGTKAGRRVAALRRLVRAQQNLNDPSMRLAEALRAPDSMKAAQALVELAREAGEGAQRRPCPPSLLAPLP